ncbi:unnamed protein product [Paramecium sonneborni]|uniref:Uncharacterized protein n=1 Tax=Paramecium sonneborni TaxID=65129 RepID=A0A8S1LTZ8_9CILI|nr:unnamed protein product [Paramecium sonneborni]
MQKSDVFKKQRINYQIQIQNKKKKIQTQLQKFILFFQSKSSNQFLLQKDYEVFGELLKQSFKNNKKRCLKLGLKNLPL